MEVRKYTIRELRARNKMSQLELSKKCGISRGLVSYYESGKRTLKPERLKQLADALNVAVEEIQF